MRIIQVITVCGSGTISSTMVSEKLKDAFAGEGIKFNTVEVKPTEVEQYVQHGIYDFIAYTTQIPKNLSLPAFNAVGFLTGLDEEGFLEKVRAFIQQVRENEVR
jgi:galactitol PTS system EIIB component